MGGGEFEEFEPSGYCNPPPCYPSLPPTYRDPPVAFPSPPTGCRAPPAGCPAPPQHHCTPPANHYTPPPGCHAMPPGNRALPPPLLNPNLFNPPPGKTDDEWDGITDEEASFAYDCAMAELQFSCLRVGGSQSNYMDCGKPKKSDQRLN